MISDFVLVGRVLLRIVSFLSRINEQISQESGFLTLRMIAEHIQVASSDKLLLHKRLLHDRSLMKKALIPGPTEDFHFAYTLGNLK